MPDQVVDDPRVYLAAERTLLAWIRTGLAMMGFGFVVARFGLFLRELEAAKQTVPTQSFHASLWFGTALVILGALVNLIAAWQNAHLVRRFREGTWNPNRQSRLGILIAVLLAIVGIAVTAYLITVR